MICWRSWKFPARFVGKGLSGELRSHWTECRIPAIWGTILRLADWFGMRDVICLETTADCFNPKVVQGHDGERSRRGAHYVPLARWLGGGACCGYSGVRNLLDGEPIYDAAPLGGGVIVMGSGAGRFTGR